MDIISKIKILMLTDEDLDGLGCAVVLNELMKKLPNIEFDVRFVGRKIYEEFDKFLEEKEYENYDYIFVTDLSISKEQAEAVLRTASNNPSEGLFKKRDMLSNKLVVLDHHNSALWLNDYPFANILLDFNGKNGLEPTSGTLLTYLYLMTEFLPTKLNITKEELVEKIGEERLIALNAFIYMVRDYDTWLWKKNCDNVPKDFNDWFLDVGIEKTFANYNKILDLITVNLETMRVLKLPEFIYEDLNYISIKRNKYIEKALKRIKIIDTEFGKIGILFAEQYISELGNKASELNPDLKFIALYNGDRFSLRTIRDDINLGTDVAKKITENGGGIPKAAGFNVKEEVSIEALKILFSNKKPEPIIKEVEKVVYKDRVKFINDKPMQKDRSPFQYYEEIDDKNDVIDFKPKKKEEPLKQSVVSIDTSNEEFKKLINDQINSRRKNRDLSSMGLFGEEESKENKQSKNINHIQHNNDDIILRPDRVENAHKRFKHGFSIADLIDADEKEKTSKGKK